MRGDFEKQEYGWLWNVCIQIDEFLIFELFFNILNLWMTETVVDETADIGGTTLDTWLGQDSYYIWQYMEKGLEHQEINTKHKGSKEGG